MAKFKKGDRVWMISRRDRVPFGTIGTVLDNDPTPDVEWQNWNEGHSGPFNDGRKTVWSVSEDGLELAPPEEALPVDPVSPDPVEPEETLRDRMAMAALAVSGANRMLDPNSVARYCYEIADAMLKERAGK